MSLCCYNKKNYSFMKIRIFVKFNVLFYKVFIGYENSNFVLE